MADNLRQSGGQDRNRININQEHELRDWADKFQVTKDQIKEAVRAVGDRAEAVEMHLKGSHATTDAERMRTAKTSSKPQ